MGDQTNISATSTEVIGKIELTKKENTNKELMKANDVNENRHKTIRMTEANTKVDMSPVENEPSLETMKQETKSGSNVKIDAELSSEMRMIDKESTSDVQNIKSEVVSNSNLNQLSASLAEKDTMKKKKKRKSIKSHQEEIDAEQNKSNDNDLTMDIKPKEENTKNTFVKAH